MGKNSLSVYFKLLTSLIDYILYLVQHVLINTNAITHITDLL